MVEKKEVLCSVCQSPLFMRACWPSIGTHKDCLDEELKKVGVLLKPHEKELKEAPLK